MNFRGISGKVLPRDEHFDHDFLWLSILWSTRQRLQFESFEHGALDDNGVNASAGSSYPFLASGKSSVVACR